MQILDLTSLGLSALCVVHCLAMPIIIAALPALALLGSADWVHKALVVTAIPLTSLALYRSGGWRNLYVCGLAVIGLALLTVAAFFAPLATHEIIISVLGALSVGAAHILNTWQHARAHRINLSHNCHSHNGVKP